MSDKRKKHFEVTNPFPIGAIKKITDQSQLGLGDVVLILRNRGESDTDRRLIKDSATGIDFLDFKNNILELVQGTAAIYDDITARDNDPASQDPAAISYVRNASGDPVVGQNIWALYLYDGGYTLLATGEDVTYQSPGADGTVAIASAGTFLEGITSIGDLRGRTLTKIIDQMLFIANPTKVDNSGSIVITTPAAGTVEEGTDVIWEADAAYNQGSITNGDTSPGPDLTGPPNQYEFTDPDGAMTQYLTAALAQSHVATNSFQIGVETRQMSVEISYDAGAGPYFDSSGAPSNIFDADRVASSIIINDSVVGRRYVFWDAGGTIPTISAEVRAAANLQFLNASDEGTFDIIIPAMTPEVWFAVPEGKTINVLYVESSFADVTGTFTNDDFNVINGGGAGNPVLYSTWSTIIGGGGYPVPATYRVTIS